MRIEKVIIPESSTQTEGIKAINIERLGSVVALIGRNGSGKTRILKLLDEFFIKGNIGIAFVLNGGITKLPRSITDNIDALNAQMYGREFFEAYLKKIEADKIKLLDPNNKTLVDQAHMADSHYRRLHDRTPQHRQPFAAFNQGITNLNANIASNLRKYFHRINYAEIHQLQNIIEAGAGSQGNNPFTFEKLIENVSEQDEYNELSSIHKTALTFLAKLPHLLVHDFNESRDEDKDFTLYTSYKRFESLKKLVKAFLNKELEWGKVKTSQTHGTEGVVTTAKGIWTLDKVEFDYTKLSDGEKNLLAYSLLFFLLEQNPNVRIKESIIVIDEPELHLHPESQIALIQGIRRIIKESGQLWIATHSINILSDLSTDEIFMVKDGVIVPPSRTTTIESFNELMGLEDHVERLSHFVTNISNWAYINFSSECFSNPDTISSAKPNDPQVEAFKKSIKETSQGKLLLDFGAGKGRVYKELINDPLLNTKLKYYALEPNEENRADLKNMGISEIFNNYSELPENTFDYILLCNVLHEIPILNWEETLDRIKKALTPEGFFILLEDTLLPKGERIEKNGYLILDAESLKELFGMKDSPEPIVVKDEKYKDRILCVPIQKAQINNISRQNIKNAVEILQRNTLVKIKELNKEGNPKNKKSLYSLGRRSAFLDRLYINTVLAKDELGK